LSILRGDGAIVKGLWQLAALVRYQNWHVRLQGTAQVDLGLREAGFDVGAARHHSSTAEPSVSLGKKVLLLLLLLLAGW
jgi:hypothetical protein